MKLWILIILVFTSSLAFAVEFKTKRLSLGKQTLTVELAETEEQTAQGLMFRKELKEGTGMLFIFPSEELRSFWMKNTFVPLSIGFFNAKKELIDIQDMTPAASEMQTNFPSYQSKGPAQYALEVPKGWFAKHKIKLRDKFRLH